MKILVTGDRGYIGCVLVHRLIEAGFDVIGCDLDVFSLDLRWKEECSGSLEKTKHLKKDVRHISEKTLDGISGIIHLAALSNDPAGFLNSELTMDINFKAGIRLAEIAKKSGVERFIFSSSCSVYGAVEGDQQVTEQSRVDPLTPYARSKVLTDDTLRKMATEKFVTTSLRNATVYGTSPRMRLDLVVNNMSAYAHTTNKVVVLSDGSAWRPIIHVEDVADAMIATLSAPKDTVNGQVFNVGINTENYNVRNIANAVSNRFNCEVSFAPAGAKDNRSYKVNFSKIHDQIKGFKPKWNLDKGVDEMHEILNKLNFTDANFKETKYNTVEHWKNFMRENPMFEKVGVI